MRCGTLCRDLGGSSVGDLKDPISVIAHRDVSFKPEARFYVVQVVLNVNLSMMHFGLMKYCEKTLGIVPDKIPHGNCVLFVNTKQNYLKLLVGTESRWPVIAAYRLPNGKKFSLQAVADIASAFKTNPRVDATFKLRQAMAKYLGREKKKAA